MNVNVFSSVRQWYTIKDGDTGMHSLFGQMLFKLSCTSEDNITRTHLAFDSSFLVNRLRINYLSVFKISSIFDLLFTNFGKYLNVDTKYYFHQVIMYILVLHLKM